MREGDKVCLKGYATTMIIESTEQVGHVNSPILKCTCVWLDKEGHPCRETFRSTVLEKA